MITEKIIKINMYKKRFRYILKWIALSFLLAMTELIVSKTKIITVNNKALPPATKYIAVKSAGPAKYLAFKGNAI